jgi:hypothetical protein
MALPRALAALLLASCATAPKPSPAPPPPARTTVERAETARDSQQEPKIVPAQMVVIGQTMSLPPAAAAPRVTVVPPETVMPVPSLGGPAPLIVVPRPPGEFRELPERVPSAPSSKPAPPVVVHPEPVVPERESEEAVKKERPPQPNRVDVNWDWQAPGPKAPRYRPCHLQGQGGPGPFKPEKAPSDWIRCTYVCGRYEVRLYDVRLKKDADGKPMDATAICKEWINLKRAEDHARSKDDALKAQGK